MPHVDAADLLPFEGVQGSRPGFQKGRSPTAKLAFHEQFDGIETPQDFDHEHSGIEELTASSRAVAMR